MSKRITKKICAAFLAVALVAATAALLLTACTKPDAFQINFRDDADLGRLESIAGAFDKNKPTLIYFHGLTADAEKSSFLRPDAYDDVLDVGESDKPVTLKNNLADYWKEQDWNVLLFHYEAEANADRTTFFHRLFENESLFEEFINVYRIYFASMATEFDATVGNGDAKGVKELRFAGDGVGADFASYAAESVAQLVREGRLSEFYLPWRLTLLNPDLDNAPYAESVSAKGAGESPLAGVTRAVKNAARLGNTVAELIESDVGYAASYAVPYDDRDREIYGELLNEVACLEINETFSATAEWSPALKETVAKVWYLATIGGSDYESTGSSSAPATIKNLPPFINNPKENYSNYSSFSISAWTPTAAIRGLKGLRFRSANINSSETPKYTERVISKFRLELFESSFPTQTLPRIGGYLFIDKNGDIYINDGRKAFMREGITVRLRYTVSGREETTLTTTTAYDGFYSFEVPAEAYNSAVYLDFEIPDYRFTWGNKDTGNKTNDELCGMSSAKENMQFVSSYWKDQYNMIKNCGYRIADQAES